MIGSIGSLYLTPIIGPVIAKKYPTNKERVMIMLVDITLSSFLKIDNTTLPTAYIAAKKNNADIEVPIVSINK